MRHKLRSRRPSHGTVVAYLALFVALATGGAYAANTIRSSDIVDGEVKTPDLANSAVTTQKIAPSSVGTGRVADESLTAADIGSGAVTDTELADNAVTGTKVRDFSLSGTDVGSNTLTGFHIDESTLTTNASCGWATEHRPSPCSFHRIDFSQQNLGGRPIFTGGENGSGMDGVDLGAACFQDRLAIVMGAPGGSVNWFLVYEKDRNPLTEANGHAFGSTTTIVRNPGQHVEGVVTYRSAQGTITFSLHTWQSHGASGAPFYCEVHGTAMVLRA